MYVGQQPTTGDFKKLDAITASANSKLKALGLTDDEIDAI